MFAEMAVPVLLFEVLPYLEELVGGLRANRGRLVSVRSNADPQAGTR